MLKSMLVVALFAAMIPAAAHAADVAQIGCVRTELGETVYHSLVQSRADHWEASLNDAMGKDTNAYLDAFERCDKANGWSKEAHRLASMYIKSQITHDAAELTLRKMGRDPAPIEAEYARLHPEDRLLLSANNPDTDGEKAVQVVMRVLNAQDIPPISEGPRLTYIISLLASVATMEFLPEKFAAA